MNGSRNTSDGSIEWQRDVSGNGAAQTGEGCRGPDRHYLCADHRGPASIPEESRRWMFYRVAAWAEELRRERATDAHQQRGDEYLRTLLVQGAHCILGPFGEDSDLRRWGQKLAERGGKNAEKRAVAVARKLAVLLHRLRVSGEVYETLRNSQKAMSAAA
jgi:hypothetical protein